MRFALKPSDDSIIVVTENGGIARIILQDGKFVSEYYQDQVDKFVFDKDLWTRLGRKYTKVWEQVKLDTSMIEDALSWLSIFTDTFEETDFDELINQYNDKERTE
jgi:hypothetical protein